VEDRQAVLFTTDEHLDAIYKAELP
jgi:hypothetical protein